MIFLIITTIIIIAMFIYTLALMLKENSYIYLLIIEFVGIIIDFISILIGKSPSMFVYTIIYCLSIVVPLTILILENNSSYIGEFSLLFNNKNIDKQKILKIIEKKPQSYVAHQKLAEYYKENQEYEKAENEYYRLVNLKPKEYSNYCSLAQMLEKNNKNEEAIEILQQVLTLKPDYYEGSMLLGNILYDNEKFKDAIIVYNEALKYNPKEYYIYYYMGMTYTRLNDFNNAKECYKKAATINSIEDISNLSIGQIYLIFEEYDKAEEYFYKTLDSDDEEVLANSYYYLAKIRLIQQNEEQAIQYANLAIEYNPKIIKRMQQDDIFVTILGKVRTTEEKNIKTKITKKDLATIEYLGKTYNVVERLTNNFTKDANNKEQEKEIN